MHVVLLGTGTPNADPQRSGPAVAIVVNDSAYLVDFGPGVVRRAVAASKKTGITALDAKNLKRAFLTHLHSDHTVGFPDLIFTPWVLGRDEAIDVYGPKGTQAMTDHLLSAYQQDIEQRLNGLEPANEVGYRVNVHEINPGLVYQDTNVTVEAFPVNHGSWPAFGYKFRSQERFVVISGDTAPMEGLVTHYTACDVLIHEVYSVAGLQKRPSDWQTYHRNVHTSSHELASLASQAKPGLLILYHQLFWGTTENELLAEIQTHYAGDVVSGKDLDVY
jgi:ribonuclease BN (tRNA processing enzyme)